MLHLAISPADILRNILVACVCGLLISFFYRKSYNGPGYSYSFLNALIFLAMITSVVIMVIGNNLARAFGLVGAMSIIRFRTAVKDTQDIVFIFFALTVGMAAGVGLYAVALLSTLAIGSIALLLSRSNITNHSKREFLLQFTFSENGHSEDAPPYQPVLEKYCRKHSIINSRAAGDGLELSYHVNLKHAPENPEFIRTLKKVHGISRVNLFFDDEYF